MADPGRTLFLSAAEEDSEVAARISSGLSALGYEVFYWQERRGGRFTERIEEAMSEAGTFVALLSPSFVASNWCRREAHLAIAREEDLRHDDPRATFIHVVEVQETWDPAAGFLRIYDRVSVIGSSDIAAALTDLNRRIVLSASASLASAAAAKQPEPEPPDFHAGENGSAAPPFRNREQELEKVINGLTGAGGPHFWLVIAPPQLGKTWFLGKLRAELDRSELTAWSIGSVELTEQPAGAGWDVAALLARLFGRSWPVTTEPESLRRIAREICTSGRSWLCLLDRAELLDESTALMLRTCISQIYTLVRRNGPADVRLGLVVASRREEKWRSVAPTPRLSTLVLTEFSREIVEEALRDLGRKMNRAIGSEMYEQTAADLHQLGEGLPELLSRCLRWISDEQWMDLHRLPTQELFEELAQPYIQTDLLSRASLFSWNGGRRQRQGETPGHPRLVLEHAFRILAPYRIFTQSHLRHHLDMDPSFADALSEAEWSIEDLWQAISGTALLRRPLDEPWQELHAAIRRLLYRYYFKSDNLRAAAHREASDFALIWSDKQSGKEQVIGLVEALWHKAVALSLDNRAEMEESLSESAWKLSHALADSAAYSVSELRAYAAERIRNDEELQKTLSGLEGLFDRLVAIIESTAGS